MDVLSRGRTQILQLSGELDLSTKKEFEAGLSTIASRKPQEVIVDLREVSFVDSTGLRLILEAWNQCRRTNVDFAVVLGDGHIRSAFRMAGLEQAIPVIEGIPSAEYRGMGPPVG
jgi:anti-sigma B factor antagonist